MKTKRYSFARNQLLTFFLLSFFFSGYAQLSPQSARKIKLFNNTTEIHQKKISPQNDPPNTQRHYNYIEKGPSDNAGYCLTDQLMDGLLEATKKRLQFDESYQEMMVNANKTSKKNGRQHYVIPIVFHVVYNTSVQNVSSSVIMGIFNQLNNDYQLLNTDANNARSLYGFTPANVDVSFCLAVRDPQNNPLSEPGINRYNTSVSHFDPNNSPNDMKYASSGGVNSWDRDHYLNVWICNISNGANSGVAGYAYSPTASYLPPSGIDGIVLDYHLGTYSGSRALTHEVGHYLGLPHTWGNSNIATSCTGAGDGINDTPVTQGPSFNYPGSCSGNQETCPGTQTQYENYMDYSNCTVMFTTGQVNVMQNILATSRSSLANSNACTPLNNQPPTADFIADITTVVSGGTVNFTDLSTNYPNGWSWSISPTTGWNYTGGTNATNQNPSVQFNTPGIYSVALTASNNVGNDTETKSNYITVVANGGGTTICDTIRNYTASEAQNMTAFGLNGETGYYPGHFTLNGGSYESNKMAEKMNAPSSSQLRGIYFPVYIAKDMGASNNITFNVYTNNADLPGTIIATETKQISDLNAGYWNYIEFSTPPTVNGDFWVSFEWTNSGNFDTLVFTTTSTNDRPFINTPSTTHTTTAVNIDGLGWYYTSDLLGPNTSQAYDVSMIVDALLSNGPTPNAVLAISTTEACENSLINVNGFGSTNTSTYQWSFIKGTNVYNGNGGDLSFNNLPVGTWDVELHAMGACLEDVATTTLTIQPSINQNILPQDEHCGQGDGAISITGITGGTGSSYNVSINNGATFSTVPPFNFNNLNAGNYTIIVKDNVCADTTAITLNDINNFNPTLTPGTSVTINEGDNITLTVNGGVSWVWYKQGETTPFETSSSTVMVSPTESTTYTVEATDANGCSQTFTITVTVNASGNAGINDENINQKITIYPNPSSGLINITADFNHKQDVKIQITDMLGKIVLEKTYIHKSKFSLPIQLRNKGNGTYIIQLSGDFGSYNQRIVIIE